MKYRVNSPEAEYKGEVGRVMFQHGTAEVDSDEYPEELRYMAQAGYTVDPPYDPQAPAEEPADDSKSTARGRRAAAKSEGESA